MEGWGKIGEVGEGETGWSGKGLADVMKLKAAVGAGGTGRCHHAATPAHQDSPCLGGHAAREADRGDSARLRHAHRLAVGQEPRLEEELGELRGLACGRAAAEQWNQWNKWNKWNTGGAWSLRYHWGHATNRRSSKETCGSLVTVGAVADRQGNG